MSVRSCALAVLTLGPAYGLQLHTEIESRTARVGRINVGQIYSTLGRLVDAGLVAPVAAHDDRDLPSYQLTDSGRLEAVAWLAGASLSSSDWDGMVEHVLLAASLPGSDTAPLLGRYREHWASATELPEPGSAEGAGQPERAAQGAQRLLAAAALEWLAFQETAIRSGELSPRELSTLRPRRGRRPTPIR